MSNICVIALIGLPCAGKTTFCKNIIRHHLDYNFIHICFDEIFKFHPENESETFKNQRKRVMLQIEQKIIESKLNSQADRLDTYVILVDDNNYYAGMRYEIYQICKASQISFGQVYIPVELDCALNRNTSRGVDALPPLVIEKMNDRLERPSSKNQWEKNTLVIRNIEESEEFCSFLKTSLASPLIRVPEKNTVEFTRVSIVHDVDLCLRKRIKEILANSERNISEKADILNKKRRSILTQIRNNNELDGSADVQNICDSFAL